jgi:hypothetical protein
LGGRARAAIKKLGVHADMITPAQTSMGAGLADRMMIDVVKVMPYARSRGETGEWVESWGEGDEVACRLVYPRVDAQRLRPGDDTTLVIGEAFLRVPVGTELNLKDRVQLVSRNGVSISNGPTYSVMSLPMHGYTRWEYRVQKARATGV